jgi:hypothetical protein
VCVVGSSLPPCTCPQLGTDNRVLLCLSSFSPYHVPSHICTTTHPGTRARLKAVEENADEEARLRCVCAPKARQGERCRLRVPDCALMYGYVCVWFSRETQAILATEGQIYAPAIPRMVQDFKGCVHSCLYMYVCMCVCMDVCMYVCTSKPAHGVVSSPTSTPHPLRTHPPLH